MLTVLGAIISGGMKWVLSYFMPSKDEKLGQLEVTDKVQKESLDEIQKSKDARDSLNSNPDIAKRVRDEYTRKNS